MNYDNIAIKTNSSLEGFYNMEEAIGKKIKKVELQFFSDKLKAHVKVKDACDELMDLTKKRGIDIDEITIHPDLRFCYVEDFLLVAENLINQMIYECHIVSEEYNIKVNLLFHIRSCTKPIEETLVDKVKAMAKLVQNYNVNLLFENAVMLQEDFPANVILLAKMVDNDHVKVCIDLTHAKARSNIFRVDNDEYIEKYIGKDNGKYIQQIHFAQALNHDGFMKKETHGRKHESYEALKHDVELFERCGLSQCIYVTEVSEDNYKTRADQIQEIKWLAKAMDEVKGEKR